jgi:hypothetical protein
MIIVGSKMGPTGTTKNSHGRIVRLFTKELIHGSIGSYDFARRAIYEINRGKKNLIPIL